MSEPLDQQGFLRRAHRFLVYFGGIYAAVLILLTVPFFQRHLIFLHKIRWPLNAEFGQPEKYGIAPQKAINMNITTSDNVTLGAWFILSDTFYKDAYRAATIPSAVLAPKSVSAALHQYPTVLYFHGNAGTRVVPFRIAAYQAYTTRLRANVLAIDYRGFADSEGSPTEDGLRKDARAAWDWAVSHGARGEDLVLIGQSLGTGVVAQLAEELSTEGKRPRGVVLISPYTSLRVLLETYNILGWLPLLKPLQTIPMAQNFVLKFLGTKYDTKAILSNIKTDIILLHAENDYDIPLPHSTTLFDMLLEPSLPPPAMTMQELQRDAHIPERWNEWLAGEERRLRIRKEVVRVDELDGFGRIQRFQRSQQGEGKVVFFESLWGGHNRIGSLEGVVDVVDQVLFRND